MPPLPEGPVRPTGYTAPATINVDLPRNNVIEVLDTPGIDVPASPYERGRTCPDLSLPENAELLFMVQQVVERHGGHLNYVPNGVSLNTVWRERIFPELFDRTGGVLGKQGISMPTGNSAPHTWRHKYMGWQKKVVERYTNEKKERNNPNLPMSPSVDKAVLQLNERSHHKQVLSTTTKKRKKSEDNAKLEAEAHGMRLASDNGLPKPLRPIAISFAKRPDLSTVDPTRKIPRSDDLIKGISEEMEDMKEMEKKFMPLVDKLLGKGGGGTNSKDAENDRKRRQIKVVTDLNALRSSYAGRTVPKWLDDEIAVEEEKLHKMTKHD